METTKKENIFSTAYGEQMYSDIMYGTGHRDFFEELILNAKAQGYIYT